MVIHTDGKNTIANRDSVFQCYNNPTKPPVSVVDDRNYWWGFAHDTSLLHWDTKTKSALYQITSDKDGGAVAYAHSRELAEEITKLLNEEK